VSGELKTFLNSPLTTHHLPLFPFCFLTNAQISIHFTGINRKFPKF
jgi:hypothetical protein